jgi:hypothetical protein
MIDRKRHDILKRLDRDAMLPEFLQMVGIPRQEPGKGDPVLAAMHKIRVNAAKHFTPEEVSISRTWLRANGYRENITRVT